MEQPYFTVNSGLLVSTQSSSRTTRERERQCKPRCKRIHLQYFSVFHLWLTRMTDGWKDMVGAHSVCFLVHFSVHKFWSLGALDASKCSVIFLESSNSLSYMMEILWNKLYDKKEGKKEGRKERRNENNLAFSTSSGFELWWNYRKC